MSPEQVLLSFPSIQAVDDPDGTIYILRRPGMDPVMAPWPQPLLLLEPTALMIESYGPGAFR